MFTQPGANNLTDRSRREWEKEFRPEHGAALSAPV
jgi:hypothetical protein